MQTVEQIVSRYQTAMQSTDTKKRYSDGIDSVTESPMEKAANAQELYLKRVEESVRSGKFANNLRATPMQRYKDNAKKKGAERLASGAMQAMDKVRAHFQKWSPIYQQVHDEVSKMDKGTLAAAQARSAKAIELLMKAAGRAA